MTSEADVTASHLFITGYGLGNVRLNCHRAMATKHRHIYADIDLLRCTVLSARHASTNNLGSYNRFGLLACSDGGSPATPWQVRKLP